MSARRNGLTVVIGGTQPWSPGQDPRQDVTSVASRANLDWQEQGLCHGTDPAIFYPDQGEKPDAALVVCRRCPVTSACLEYALTFEDGATDPHGVWGATGAEERRAMLTARRKARLARQRQAAA